MLALFAADPDILEGAKEYYASHYVDFVCGWMDTYDPRKAKAGLNAWMPFVMFERQAEFIEFLDACLKGESSGLAEKSRDMGATWAAAAYTVCLWLFRDGASIGWGSRAQDLLDRIGDLDSIFEKMRQGIVRLPKCFWPEGFKPDAHMYYLRILNPQNGNTITGEIGPNIGRGGRKLIYFKDESAHYERPDMIEAALMDNTNVQIDISSVNGIGNVFYRKRDTGKDWEPGEPVVKDQTNVFVMDWRSHPEKDQAWYDARRKKAEGEGLLHVFKQEVDRDYSGAVLGTIIPAEWVKAAENAHLKLGFEPEGPCISGLDIADGGGDTNAQSARKGPVLYFLDEWGARDTAVSARRAIDNIKNEGKRASLQYDAVGVGSGVKAEANRLRDEKKLPPGLNFEAWFASASPLFPKEHIIKGDKKSPLNQDFYANLKAQGWWELRLRFERTWRAVTQGEKFPPDQLISLDKESIGPLYNKLVKELSQPTQGTNPSLKLIVNKKPDGTKSPNLADCVMMAFWPVRTSTYDTTFSWV